MPKFPEEVSIGVVGADDIVRRVIESAQEVGESAWRLLPSVYDDEQDAYSSAVAIADRVDVWLFAGPLPYDVAMAPGDLPGPATYIPMGGSALYAALLKGAIEGLFDPLRITVDSVTADEVRAAYGEVGMEPEAVRVQPYDGPESAATFLEFHRAHFADGLTSGAVTTVPTVVAALAEAGVPSLKMTPTHATIRHALNTAALLGSGARLEESRIVTVVVRLPSGVAPGPATPGNYGYQELKLSLHRELIREARPMDAVVLPRDENSYLVVTTMGSLNAATGDLEFAPFIDGVARNLGIDLEVGIGLGNSAREAEFNAQTAVERAVASQGAAFLVGPRRAVLQLPTQHHAVSRGDAPASHTDENPKTLETLRVLVERLEGVRIVDAEKAATALGVTLRTARRTLQSLVHEGLAWPMPPSRSSRVGRPPRTYRLLTDRLERDRVDH